MKRLAQQAGAEKQTGDNAHGLLCIVAAVPHAVECGREKLSFSKNMVNLPRCGFSAYPVNDVAEKHSNKSPTIGEMNMNATVLIIPDQTRAVVPS